MAILFVASEAFELEPFAARLTGVRPLKWPLAYAREGVWEGKRYLLAANGAGPRLASKCVEIALRATAMADLSSSRLEGVVSTGLCGALQSGIEIGDIIEANRICNSDSSEEITCVPIESNRSSRVGVVLSADRVAGTIEEKRTLSQTGALAIEMEAVGVARRAIAAGLPFCCVKVVSDRADERFVMDFNSFRSTDGHFARGKIVFYALTHPQVLPRLLSLRRRSQDAASALGAFLASCRFQFSDGSRSTPDAEPA
jgi:adenosylhomocysteine/aminodeoxyfutalosine nucleosidase